LLGKLNDALIKNLLIITLNMGQIIDKCCCSNSSLTTSAYLYGHDSYPRSLSYGTIRFEDLNRPDADAMLSGPPPLRRQGSGLPLCPSQDSLKERHLKE
jgi:hypothetical protein